MSIKSTFFLTNIHTVIRTVSGIVMNKIIAVYLGPSGLALLGQFSNFSVIATSIASGSINTGIVKYTAQYSEKKEDLYKLWSNALLINIVLSFITSVFVLIFNDYLCFKVFKTNKYSLLVIIFSISIIFYTLNLYITSILNGLHDIKLYTLINILLSIITLITTIVLTIYFNMFGALLSIVLTQSFVFFVTFILIYKKYKLNFFRLKGMLKNFNIKIISNLFAYAVLTFTSGVGLSITMILIRSFLIDNLSLHFAGYWEGLWKISTYYFVIFNLPISVHYLPLFSKAKDYVVIQKDLMQSLKFFLPLQILCAIGIFLFRYIWINLLFSSEFLMMEPLVKVMVVGDVIRLTASQFGNIFLARAEMKIIFMGEISFNAIFIILSYAFIKSFELTGVSYAYVLVSVLLLLFYFFCFRTIKNKECAEKNKI